MNLRQHLDSIISQALDEVSGEKGCQALIQYAKDPKFGNYQANGVMAIAKKIGINPRQLGEEVINKLDLSSVADKVELAGPGFINIFISPAFLSENLNQSQQSNEINLTSSDILNVVVDYSSPNLAKEIATLSPTGAVVASTDAEVRKEVQETLRSANFRVYANDDMLGV